MKLFALALLSLSQAAQAGIVVGIDVAGYGAKCDGVTNDTAALRAAANAVPASGATLTFPRGRTCVIRGTIYLKSHTTVDGNGATLLASMPWATSMPYGYALMENVNHGDFLAETNPVIDTNITVRNLTFDYGNVAPMPTPNGGKHALRFRFARNITVKNNIFQVRRAENAVAGVGVDKMLVQGNFAYDFRNCAYDFWHGPSNVEVIGNFAQTSASNQMVNFNPDRTRPGGGAITAQNFTLTGNTFTATGPVAVPMQIEPLEAGGTVRNVVVGDNTLHNVLIVMRSQVEQAIVAGNRINNVKGGAPVFFSHPFYGSTPSAVAFYNNVIVNPETSAANLGVIFIQAHNSTARRNWLSGTAYSAPYIYTGGLPVSLSANQLGTVWAPEPVLRLGVFNPVWYLANNGDLQAAFGSTGYADAIEHWFSTGIGEGRRAQLFFSTQQYLKIYPDLRAAFGANNYLAAAQHYAYQGISENRAGLIALHGQVFNAEFYLQSHSDLKSAFGGNTEEARRHWIASGLGEGRRGATTFWSVAYLNRYPDLAALFGTKYFKAVEHYVLYGRAEGRIGN